MDNTTLLILHHNFASAGWRLVWARSVVLIRRDGAQTGRLLILKAA
jgi:hypothetical protein